jgi:transposase
MSVLWFFETTAIIEKQRRYRAQYGKDRPSVNAIQRWLQQFKETGNVLDRRGAEKPRTSREDADRIQEAFSRNP